jgi:hypothetical protein
MRRTFLSLALGSSLLWVQPAAAEQPRVCDERMIRDEAHRARVWRYSWAGINAALMIGAFVAVPLVDKEERPDWVVSGAGSAINVATTWFWPLRVESAEDELDALPPAERARHVPRLVLESSEDEHDRVTWHWHLANFGVSALGGGIIAFGYGHYESGLLTTLAGTAIGSTQIFTQPTNLPRTCVAPAPARSRLTLSPSFTVLRAPDQSPSGGALSITGTF